MKCHPEYIERIFVRPNPAKGYADIYAFCPKCGEPSDGFEPIELSKFFVSLTLNQFQPMTMGPIYDRLDLNRN